MSIRVKFAWYDLWIGAYIDRENRTLYVCPLPMLLFVFARNRAALASRPASTLKAPPKPADSLRSVLPAATQEDTNA